MQVSPESPGTLCRAICVAPAWTGYTHMRLASEGSAQGQAQAYSQRVSCRYIQPQYIAHVRPFAGSNSRTCSDARGARKTAHRIDNDLKKATIDA